MQTAIINEINDAKTAAEQRCLAKTSVRQVALEQRDAATIMATALKKSKKS